MKFSVSICKINAIRLFKIEHTFARVWPTAYTYIVHIYECVCVCVLQQPRPVLLSQPKQIHHFKVIHYISCMPDILDVYQLIVHTQATSNKQPHRIVYKLQIIIIATDHHISGPLSLYTIQFYENWNEWIKFGSFSAVSTGPLYMPRPTHIDSRISRNSIVDWCMYTVDCTRDNYLSLQRNLGEQYTRCD